MAESCKEFELHPVQINDWKRQLLNVFVERLWRIIKYERVYLRAYDGVSAAKIDVAQLIDWYNTERPHSSLDDQTPDQTYRALLPALQQAAWNENLRCAPSCPPRRPGRRKRRPPPWTTAAPVPMTRRLFISWGRTVQTSGATSLAMTDLGAHIEH
jgi:putative transposase